MDEDTLYRVAIYLTEGLIRGDELTIEEIDELTIEEIAEDLDISEEQAQEACLSLLPLRREEA